MRTFTHRTEGLDVPWLWGDPFLSRRRDRHAALVAVILLVLTIPAKPTVSVDDIEIESIAFEVKNWALGFGKALTEGSAEATCSRKITENFNDMGAKVEWVDANKMLQEMKVDVQNMLGWKREVVKKIANVAERAVAKHTYDPHIKLSYYNAKKLYDQRDEKPKEDEEGWNHMIFKHHRNFEITPVNMQHSAIHVPTNVFNKAPDILNGIKWSQELNQTFHNNMGYDPFLSYQFFGSSTGFFRIYPAIKWKVPEGPDMYDCRMRRWYIQAAASPKDIVILLDGSGSMSGLRKEIARNVVLNILETLTDNDYVTILRFSNFVETIVPCFENILVQANERNLREFREHLDDLETIDIANFTLALVNAFELLQKVDRMKEGCQCNQAIMLITDGAPYTYEKIFKQYNWPNIPVRVFTYLIGREVTDMHEVHWMACNNRGYYTHVTTLAEVREQVQKYIPVMSRPVVLSGTHPFIWSSVYADVTELKLSDWLWEKRERAKIRKLIVKEREKRQRESSENDESPMMQTYPDPGNGSEMEQMHNGPLSDISPEPEIPRKTHKKKNTPNESSSTLTVQLMTTVATPVFDRRNYSNVTERIRTSKNVWIERTREMRVADLLGVAGTDIPVKEIIKLTPAYKLGVNGYSYVISNNGYVLYHPDLRPMFQDLIKPDYSSVDMLEVELVDSNLPPREYDETLLLMRNTTINRRIGWNKLPVKVHLDSMKRVVTRNNSYYYGPIEMTPFSLAIALPEPYGHYQVVGKVEVKRQEENWMDYFKGSNWRVHPEWVYCENLRRDADIYVVPEDVIRNFLKEAVNKQEFRWRTTSLRPPLYDEPICERDLVQSLVFDAKATDVDTKKCLPPKLPSHYDPLGLLLALLPREKMIKLYGITITFVATRSGLLRFKDHRSEEEKANSTERPFYEIHTKAIEELFYRRAVDFYSINNSAFIFSVPFDAGSRNNSLVTGSQAVFLGLGKKKAPVAVVGLQFKHVQFADRFFNITGRCLKNCKYKCNDNELDCFLLDNNGFIIVSEIHEQTGKFFGEIDFNLFNSMVHEGIYKRVHIYDYQAICLDVSVPSGPASILTTPYFHIKTLLYWFWSKIVMFFVQYNLYIWWTEQGAKASDYYYYDYDYEDERLLPNKTRPRPCDKEVDLYEMQQTDSWEPVKGVLPKCHSSGCDKHYIVQKVPYTNLVMLVVYATCGCDTTSVTLEPKEVNYETVAMCQRMRNGTFRARPEICLNHHSEEVEIKQCGNGSQISASIYSFMGFVFPLWFFSHTFV